MGTLHIIVNTTHQFILRQYYIWLRQPLAIVCNACINYNNQKSNRLKIYEKQ